MTEVEKLIPHRPPFLFVDEIVSHEGDVLVAKRTWRAEEDFYQGHYPGAPITPGVLLCESVFQTGALLMAKLMSGAGGQSAASTGSGQGVPLLTKVTDVRFRLPVYPGDTTTIEVRRKETLGDFHFMTGTMKNGEKRVLNLEFSVAWKKPEGQVTS
ncbi:MAG: beta-hydroxyacyl-ACP dehydratase [Lacunisphaera sp.]|nr:beta-hydroxyacyl-ACP dehydratase [Lacunisphaera sp.]